MPNLNVFQHTAVYSEVVSIFTSMFCVIFVHK